MDHWLARLTSARGMLLQAIRGMGLETPADVDQYVEAALGGTILAETAHMIAKVLPDVQAESWRWSPAVPWKDPT